MGEASKSGAAEGPFSVDPADIHIDEQGRVVISNDRLKETLESLSSKRVKPVEGTNTGCGLGC
ncbi:hypothetical protein [Streptomyces sp. ODS28]|uniref:hypothetical protein n=1 Tax=Streptomyces sp. ODS28 TaxID=3136688 RepID=UPI0031E8892E